MGLFACIFENTLDNKYHYLEGSPLHFVLGNVHKVAENKENWKMLWGYFGYRSPPSNSTTWYDNKGVDLPHLQLGVILQGNFSPKFCPLCGLTKMNQCKDKTFQVSCLVDGKVKIGPLSADYFCTNLRMTRPVKVTPSCDWSNKTHPITLADHAIVFPLKYRVFNGSTGSSMSMDVQPLELQ